MGRQRRPECIERHGDTYLVRRTVRVSGVEYAVMNCKECNRERVAARRRDEAKSEGRAMLRRGRPESAAPFVFATIVREPEPVVAPKVPHTDRCAPWDGQACDECQGLWMEVASCRGVPGAAADEGAELQRKPGAGRSRVPPVTRGANSKGVGR
jgi:hypothetical protein